MNSLFDLGGFLGLFCFQRSFSDLIQINFELFYSLIKFLIDCKQIDLEILDVHYV